MGSALALGLVLLAGSFLASGCKGKPDNASAMDAAPPATVAAAIGKFPSDHAASDELVEGPDITYGVHVPFGFHITSHVDKEFTAIGTATKAKVIKYLSARVSGGTAAERDGVTTFKNVRSPSDPDRPLELEVRDGPTFGTLITFRDATPPPAALPGTQEEIFKRAGLDRNGRPLDKSKME
jgi:hypothetical protein